MSKIVQLCIDLLFPPSKQEEELIQYSPQQLRNECAKAHNIPHEKIYSIFSYKDSAIKRVVKSLKYQAHPHALTLASDILSEELIDLLSEKQQFGEFLSPLLIPIPMHIRRKRKRGWNQCDLLTQRIAQKTNIPIDIKALRRNKYTVSQTKVSSKKKRLQNPKGSFEVEKPDVIYGAEIILIDDVTTTGATLVEARKILEEAGAKRVIALTFAH